MGVGSYGHGTVHHALIETWSTGAWHASTGGTSGAYDAVLTAVSCPSATDCVAVGSDRPTGTVAADGGIFAFGDAPFYGSMGGQLLDAPVVGMAASPGDTGHWVIQSTGWIDNFGHAGYGGSEGDRALNAPIVGVTAAVTA